MTPESEYHGRGRPAVRGRRPRWAIVPRCRPHGGAKRQFRAVQRGRCGFSLVEVLLAVLVVAIGVIPVISVFLSSSRTVEKGGVMLAATIAGQNILDRVKSDDFVWDHLDQSFSVPGDTLPGVTLPRFFAEKYQATAQVTIKLADGHTVVGTGAKETNLAEIVVEVKWLEYGAQRQTRLITYKANTNSFNLRTSSRL